METRRVAFVLGLCSLSCLSLAGPFKYEIEVIVSEREDFENIFEASRPSIGDNGSVMFQTIYSDPAPHPSVYAYESGVFTKLSGAGVDSVSEDNLISQDGRVMAWLEYENGQGMLKRRVDGVIDLTYNIPDTFIFSAWAATVGANNNGTLVYSNVYTGEIGRLWYDGSYQRFGGTANGVEQFWNVPAMNNAGDVVYVGYIQAPLGLFVNNTPVYTGGEFDFISSSGHDIDDAGRIAFVTQPAPPDPMSGLYVYDNGVTKPIVEYPGFHVSATQGGKSYGGNVGMNSAGDIAVLCDPDGVGGDPHGLWVFHADGSRSLVLSSETVLPGETFGVFMDRCIGPGSINEHGQVVFTYRISGDQFIAIATPIEPCLADLAEPFGLLDLGDISAFTGGFIASDPIADLDGNGLFDLSDIGAFVDSFLAGCP